MKRVALVICTIWAATQIAACGSSNSTPTLGASNFTVTLEQGSGQFTPAVAVTPDASGATVTVTATNAAGLSNAYFYVHYDPAKYTPQNVQLGTLLGKGGQVISLALTDISGKVPVG